LRRSASSPAATPRTCAIHSALLLLRTHARTRARAPTAVARDHGCTDFKVARDVLVLCHGGPIATPEDARFILQHCPGCDGFYGASSMERLPTEVALTETTQAFTRIRREAAAATAVARKSSKRRAP
jgi:hypothetical protein